MEGWPHWLDRSIDLWATLFFLGNQVTQRAGAIMISINQFSVLQNPATAAHFSARMYAASLVKGSRELSCRSGKRQSMEQ